MAVVIWPIVVPFSDCSDSGEQRCFAAVGSLINLDKG